MIQRMVRGFHSWRPRSFPNASGSAAGGAPRKGRFSAEDIKQIQLLVKARQEAYKKNLRTGVYYTTAGIIFAGTLTYACVPLYRALCSRTGWGGTPITDLTKFSADRMIPVERDRRITVKFSSEVSSQLPWTFRPEQREVQVLPGETALAFYKAKNTSNEPLLGMATYTVVPDRAAAYFSKIQCFCFEEQLLLPGEEVDMPVFFFIDPDFARDPSMQNIHDIVLHYTFFLAHNNDRKKARAEANRLAESIQQKA